MSVKRSRLGRRGVRPPRCLLAWTAGRDRHWQAGGRHARPSGPRATPRKWCCRLDLVAGHARAPHGACVRDDGRRRVVPDPGAAGTCARRRRRRMFTSGFPRSGASEHRMTSASTTRATCPTPTSCGATTEFPQSCHECGSVSSGGKIGGRPPRGALRGRPVGLNQGLNRNTVQLGLHRCSLGGSAVEFGDLPGPCPVGVRAVGPR